MLNEKRLSKFLLAHPVLLGEQRLFSDHVGREFSNRTIHFGDRAGIINDAKHRLESCVFRNLELVGLGQSEDWGFNCYNVTGCTFENIRVRDVKFEHGFYLRTHGSNVFRGIRVENCGSQGGQFVGRARHHGGLECIDPAQYAMPGVLAIEDIYASNCGTPTGRRPSWALYFAACQGEPPEGVPTRGSSLWIGEMVVTNDYGALPNGDPRALCIEGGPHGWPEATIDHLVAMLPNTEANEWAQFDCVPRLVVAKLEAEVPKSCFLRVRARLGDVVSLPKTTTPVTVRFEACDDAGKPMKGKAATFYLNAGAFHKVAGVWP